MPVLNSILAFKCFLHFFQGQEIHFDLKLLSPHLFQDKVHDSDKSFIKWQDLFLNSIFPSPKLREMKTVSFVYSIIFSFCQLLAGHMTGFMALFGCFLSKCTFAVVVVDFTTNIFFMYTASNLTGLLGLRKQNGKKRMCLFGLTQAANMSLSTQVVTLTQRSCRLYQCLHPALYSSSKTQLHTCKTYEVNTLTLKHYSNLRFLQQALLNIKQGLCLSETTV